MLPLTLAKAMYDVMAKRQKHQCGNEVPDPKVTPMMLLPPVHAFV